MLRVSSESQLINPDEVKAVLSETNDAFTEQNTCKFPEAKPPGFWNQSMKFPVLGLAAVLSALQPVILVYFLVQNHEALLTVLCNLYTCGTHIICTIGNGLIQTLLSLEYLAHGILAWLDWKSIINAVQSIRSNIPEVQAPLVTGATTAVQTVTAVPNWFRDFFSGQAFHCGTWPFSLLKDADYACTSSENESESVLYLEIGILYIVLLVLALVTINYVDNIIARNSRRLCKFLGWSFGWIYWLLCRPVQGAVWVYGRFRKTDPPNDNTQAPESQPEDSSSLLDSARTRAFAILAFCHTAQALQYVGHQLKSIYYANDICLDETLTQPEDVQDGKPLAVNLVIQHCQKLTKAMPFASMWRRLPARNSTMKDNIDKWYKMACKCNLRDITIQLVQNANALPSLASVDLFCTTTDSYTDFTKAVHGYWPAVKYLVDNNILPAVVNGNEDLKASNVIKGLTERNQKAQQDRTTKVNRIKSFSPLLVAALLLIVHLLYNAYAPECMTLPALINVDEMKQSVSDSFMASAAKDDVYYTYTYTETVTRTVNVTVPCPLYTPFDHLFKSNRYDRNATKCYEPQEREEEQVRTSKPVLDATKLALRVSEECNALSSFKKLQYVHSWGLVVLVTAIPAYLWIAFAIQWVVYWCLLEPNFLRR